MSQDSPAAIIFNIDGYEVSIKDGYTITSDRSGFILVGKDGSTARFVSVDSSGRPIIVGAGTAGSPSGGVVTIQGAVGGTTIPVSGTITANNASVSTTGTAPPASATYIGASVTTGLPSHTTGQMESLSLTTSGLLRIDGSSVTQPISAVSLPLPTGAATEASLVKLPLTQGSTTSGQSGMLQLAAVTTSAPSYTTGQSSPLSLDTSGALRITGSISASNPSVSTTESAPPASATYQGGSVTTSAPSYTTGQMSALSLTTSGSLRTDGSGVTQPISGTVTANAGTGNFTVVQSTAANLRSQTASEATTATAIGTVASLTGGSVTTSAPSYTTGQMNSLSLTTTGQLRVDGSGSTQPVSGTITANAGSGTFAISAVSLPLPTGAATETTLSAMSSKLPAALVGGRLDINNGAWLGSTAPTVGSKTSANSIPVVIASDQATLSTKEIRSSSPDVTSVAGSATNATLKASNANRLGITIYNDSTKALYLKLGSVASTSSFTVKINKDGYYEVPFDYTGIIDGIWESGVSGNALVTELT